MNLRGGKKTVKLNLLSIEIHMTEREFKPIQSVFLDLAT